MKKPESFLTRWLLALARGTIVRALGLPNGTEDEIIPTEPPPEMDAVRAQGLFVTLKTVRMSDGCPCKPRLRGCIGRFSLEDSLPFTVEAMALAAAFEDPRFPPLEAGELNQVDVEITLLGPREPVAGPQDILLGQHGICMECRRHFAVFLPQVATEQGWNLEQTLAALSRKAGLPVGAWKEKKCRFEVFEACHFGESAQESGGNDHGRKNHL